MHGIAYLTAMGDELHFFGIVKFNFSTFLAFLLLFMIETFSLKSSDLSTVL